MSPKVPRPVGGQGFDLIHGFLAHASAHQTIGSAIFEGLSRDQYTDRPRYNVCSNSPRLALHAVCELVIAY